MAIRIFVKKCTFLASSYESDPLVSEVDQVLELGLRNFNR